MQESQLLEQIYAAAKSLPRHVIVPPGDDMAVIRLGEAAVLVGVDQIADTVHFHLNRTPIPKIAHKLVARNLSDVAAMGAQPAGMVVSVCLPRDFSSGQATELYEAIHQKCLALACPLIGGDTAIWDHPLQLSATVLAEAQGVEPVLRSGAKPGDVIFVTGCLGGSQETIDGYTHHLDFQPRVEVARKLATLPAIRLHGMIDVSDGLGVDLARICHSSHVCADIYEKDLPVSAAAQVASQRDGVAVWRHALSDGEDYELCFTVPAEDAPQVPRQIDQIPISSIGTIRARDSQWPVTLVHPDGSREDAAGLGWEHLGGPLDLRTDPV